MLDPMATFSLRRALFELLLGLGRPGGNRCGCTRIGALQRRGAHGCRHVCGLRRRHVRSSSYWLRLRGVCCRKLNDLARAHHAVGLLDLQVREATHGFGRPCSLGRLFEVTPVTLGRTLQPVLEVNLFDVGRHAVELGKRALFGNGRAADEACRYGAKEKADPPHHCTSLLACAWVARS